LSIVSVILVDNRGPKVRSHGLKLIGAPRHLLTILDEPRYLPETFGFPTTGWNAV
jgi:hypothetical protein